MIPECARGFYGISDKQSIRIKFSFFGIERRKFFWQSLLLFELLYARLLLSRDQSMKRMTAFHQDKIRNIDNSISRSETDRFELLL